MDRAATGASPERAVAVRALATARTPGSEIGRSPLPTRPAPTSAPPIRALPLAAAQSAAPDPHAPGHRPHNLPQALTSFVGRACEIAEATRLLGVTRLLTLTGAGGVGKTRLAHEVAAGLLDAFPGGVRVVELAALTDPALVPQALAAVLAVAEEPDRPLSATLAERLHAEQLLLVLDNCEHLVEACAVLADLLLRACPGLRLLATSRQPLGIDGETTFRVPSLATSPNGPCAATPVARFGSVLNGIPSLCPALAEPPAPSEAARLFVERARAAAPSFSLTDRNRAAVEEICRRLDGIPLAIELAAVRVAVLAPETIAARLSDRFGLLTGGSRTALPRYRTLRALIDWSHDLLDEPERILFRRLAVFAGGWTLDAAESVCTGDGLAPEDTLDLIARLVAKSLVLPVEDGDEVRYRLLETLREYAVEKLRAADEEPALRERHRSWCLALAERAAPELIAKHQDQWLARLDRERDNLRAAQRWAATRGDAQTLIRLGAALWPFWWARANAAEARDLIAEALPLAREATPTPALAQALQGAAMLAGSLGEYPTCRMLFEAGLAVARQLEDRRALAALLDRFGRQLFVEGRYAEARADLDEAITIFRELGDHHGLSRALSHLGFLDYLEDRREEARAAYQEGMILAREAGDLGAVAEFLDNLGRTLQADGDFDSAERAYQDAVAIWRETGQGHWLAMALNNLGSVQTLRGEHGAARASLAEALDLSQRLGNRRRLAFTLAAAAVLAAASGEAERAVRLDAVASAIVAEIGASLVQPMTRPSAPLLERARASLGIPGTAAATAAGRALTPALAVTETLAWLTSPSAPDRAGGQQANAPIVSAVPAQPRPPDGAGPPASPLPSILSRRELEVAALVSRGLTNRQIAIELVIAEGTAANHVKHILARLCLDSRAQIAVWAAERGLHRFAPAAERAQPIATSRPRF